jgi:tripartite-type tricarboxylate transporter receptor subunit TctC
MNNASTPDGNSNFQKSNFCGLTGMPVALLAAALAVASSAALGQSRDFPNRPVKLIVPFAPGSATDISGRFFGNQLAIVLGQPVIIENRPGADGSIGIMAAKNSPADGYTHVVAGWTNLTVNPVVMKDLPYDPIKDFKPVSGLTRSMLGLTVSGGSNIKTLDDLVAAAKKSPKLLDFGTFSAGYLLAMEWFANTTGVRFNHVPYKSGATINTDLMGNQIAATVDAMSALGPQVRSGKLRVLAVTGEARHPEFPDIPTVKESGYPEYSIYGWSAIYTRAETPEDITNKMAEAMQKVMASPAAQEYRKKVGSEFLTGPPAVMRKFQLDQYQNFKRVAESAGIKPE